jgi:hypothetical protein
MERWAQGCYPEIAEIKEEEIETEETDEERYQRIIEEADEEIALLREKLALTKKLIEIQKEINALWSNPLPVEDK